MKTSHVETALDEMEYRTGEGNFGQDMSVSIPCQLKFTESPTQDTEKFHEALKDRGYTPIDHEPDKLYGEEGKGAYYDGEICSQDHFDRMKVLVFRGDVIRLYPHDNWDPTAKELATITKAIEIGFDAALVHDPIDDE